MGTSEWSGKSGTRPKILTDSTDSVLKDIKDLEHAAGLFSKQEIDKLKYNKFTKRGVVIDSYNFIPKTHELVFFTKFDLHICGDDAGSVTSLSRLNPDLADDPFFKELKSRYPEVIRQLQLSALNSLGSYPNTGDKSPFMNLLTYAMNGSVDLPSITAETSDLPENLFGTSYSYRTTGEAQDDNPTFSVEFKDGPDLQVYMFFKAFEKYEQLKNHGIIAPFDKYRTKKILHDQCGIYKFTLDQDLSTIIHYAYFWGAYPISVPRDAFSNPIDGGLTFAVDWKAAFVDDLDPMTLRDFNTLTNSAWERKVGKVTSTDFSDKVNAFEKAGVEFGMEMKTDFVLNNMVSVPHILKDKNNRYHLVWR